MSDEQFITIMDLPKTPPLGRVPGRITDVVVEAGTKEGKAFKRLGVIAQLEATDDGGRGFIVKKTYNVLGRGCKDFCKDASSFTGQRIGLNDLRKFNKGLLVNKPALLEVKERKEGKEVVPHFTEFLPVPQDGSAQQ